MFIFEILTMKTAKNVGLGIYYKNLVVLSLNHFKVFIEDFRNVIATLIVQITDFIYLFICSLNDLDRIQLF